MTKGGAPAAGKEAKRLAGEEAPPPKKNRRKLIIAASAILVLLLLGGGGAAWFLSTSAPQGKPGQKTKAKEAEKAKEVKPPQFMSLEGFTINLRSEEGEHYLQINIVLEVSDEKAMDAIKAQMPVIRSTLLLLLSSKLPSQINTTQGKETLAAEILAETTKQTRFASPEQTINRVLFNAFIIQ
jgi:flagellar FliL protein